MGWQTVLVLFGLLMAGLLGFAFVLARAKAAQDDEALAELTTWAAANGWGSAGNSARRRRCCWWRSCVHRREPWP